MDTSVSRLGWIPNDNAKVGLSFAYLSKSAQFRLRIEYHIQKSPGVRRDAGGIIADSST